MDERSPYAPPLSAIEVAVERKGSPWKAMLLGLLVDIGGTLLLDVIVGIAVWAALNQGMAQNEIEHLFDSRTSPLVLALTLTGGLLSLLGGYVCARVARHNELKLGGVMALFSVTFGVLLGNYVIDAYHLMLHAATLAAVLFGAWLGMRYNLRRCRAT